LISVLISDMDVFLEGVFDTGSDNTSRRSL